MGYSRNSSRGRLPESDMRGCRLIHLLQPKGRNHVMGPLYRVLGNRDLLHSVFAVPQPQTGDGE